MKRNKLAATVLAVVFGLSAGTLLAGENFKDSIKAGEAFRKEKKYDAALNQFDQAVQQSENNTERGIALSKRAFVCAYDQKDYAAAREAANKALAFEDTRPVARVTALQVLADCQMKADKDFNAAAETLEKAMKLENVDWAMPSLALMLGDCYRNTGRFPDAIAVYQKVQAMVAASYSVKAVAYLNTGLTKQYNLNDAAGAKDAYAKAAELSPELKAEIKAHEAKLSE